MFLYIASTRTSGLYRSVMGVEAWIGRQSRRVIERLVGNVDRILASAPHQSPNPSVSDGIEGESRN